VKEEVVKKRKKCLNEGDVLLLLLGCGYVILTTEGEGEEKKERAAARGGKDKVRYRMDEAE
jgi:hypothetical protein